MSQASCYDCGDICTHDWEYHDVLSETGNSMRLAFHRKCWERAILGGPPIYPERKQTHEPRKM